MATLHIKALLDDATEVVDKVQLRPELTDDQVQKAMTSVAVQLANQGIADGVEGSDVVTVYPPHRIRQITVERSRIDMPTTQERGKILAGK